MHNVNLFRILKTEIIESLKEAFSVFHQGDGLLFPSATWIVTGIK